MARRPGFMAQFWCVSLSVVGTECVCGGLSGGEGGWRCLNSFSVVFSVSFPFSGGGESGHNFPTPICFNAAALVS